MTEKKLTLRIEAGEKTCSSAPGKFCRFLLTSRFGTRWHCQLFDIRGRDEPGQWTSRREEGGMLMRSRECLTSEEG